MNLKALRESPIGKESPNIASLNKHKAKLEAEKADEEAALIIRVNAFIKQAEQKQCLSIGQDLCNLIGSIMVEEPEKGAWIAEKLKPIIQQLQRGAGIDASTK